MNKNLIRLSSLLFLLLLPPLNAQPVWEKVGFEMGEYKYIRCINDLNCIGMVTHSEGNAKLVKSTDGGKTWFDLYVENYIPKENGLRIFPDPREMCSLSYVDENHIFVGRNKGCIFVSRDGGMTFDTVVIAEKIDDTFVSASRIFDLYMADSLNGAAISSPYICITNDGWKTFKRIKLNNTIVPEGYSYAIGGGLTNTLKFWNSRNFMMAISVIKEIGVNQFEHLHRGVIITIDGGETWNILDFIPIFQQTYLYADDVFFLGDVGWLIGNIVLKSGYSYTHGFVFKSYDRGNTWNFLYRDSTERMTGFSSIAFTDKLNGTVVGRYGKILRTTDGGYTWFRDSFLNLSSFERDLRIVQKVTYAGEHVLLSTFGDGIWRGTYPASSVFESTEVGNGLVIHPNPATEYITIQTSEVFKTSKVSDIKIFNMLGECVIHLTPTLSEGEGVRINVLHLPPGLYFVRYGNQAEKFVKW